MKISPTKIKGCLAIKFDKHFDSRGSFIKTFNEDLFENTDLALFNLREEYYSSSNKNVFRGFHFQQPPHDHNKFVYCISGRVIDYFLDIRLYSKTYGKVCSVRLGDDENAFDGVYLPRGIAHGFLSEIDNSTLVYKTDTKYNAESDEGINWRSFDKAINCDKPIISERDNSFKEFREFKTPFNQL